jgi:hypothetical protein
MWEFSLNLQLPPEIHHDLTCYLQESVHAGEPEGRDRSILPVLGGGPLHAAWRRDLRARALVMTGAMTAPVSAPGVESGVALSSIWPAIHRRCSPGPLGAASASASAISSQCSFAASPELVLHQHQARLRRHLCRYTAASLHPLQCPTRGAC